MIITKDTLLFLNPGDIVKVITAEHGAKGAEEKIGIYMGLRNDFSIPYGSRINGLSVFRADDVIIKTEERSYWIIGKDVELEIIKEEKEIKKESTMIIKDFEISKSKNGITVNFTDGTYKKSYAVAPDEFDIKKALYICLAKKYSHEYKCDDIEELAKFFAMTKKYIREVKRVLAEYEKKEEVKKIIANRKAKKIRYKANKKAREREEMIEIQKEAYLRAMREANK